MPSLEELVYSKVTTDPELSGMLASFGDVPAVFERSAPPDTDSGWAGQAQYPRVGFQFDRRENIERGVAGTGIFSIWSLGQSPVRPEQIEARLSTLLNNSIFHPEGGSITVLRWFRSNNYTEPARVDRGGDVTIGTIAQFDMISFANQETFSPDPILALKNWIQTVVPEVQADPESWSPIEDSPALYFRFAGTPKGERFNWGYRIWADIRIHVICLSEESRVFWCRRVHEQLLASSEVILDDGSMMYIKMPAWTGASDEFTTGQIMFQGLFRALIDRSGDGTGSNIENAITSTP